MPARKKKWALKRDEPEIKPSILAKFLRVRGTAIKDYAAELGISLRKGKRSQVYRWLTRREAEDIMKLHYARKGAASRRARTGQSSSDRASSPE